MFLDEVKRVFQGKWQVVVDILLIKNFDFIGAAKATALNPGIRKLALSHQAKQKHTSHCWDEPPLMLSNQS